jgi:hypothetical protein
MHTGSLVVNYPYDANASGAYVYTPTPDDDLFIHISEEYSQHNEPMWNSSYFYHGITNGADWYVIYGGMQDWNYVYMGCNEVTLELSNTKIPSASQIPTYWSQNRDSMLAYMATCLIGVRGIVTDAGTGEPLAATVTVAGRNHEVYTDPDMGDYHRMLLPGTYNLTFEADGYDPVTVSGVVVSSGDATRLDVALNPPMHVVYPNGGETLAAGVPVNVTWTGGETAQFQVQYTDNYEEIGPGTDDFERDELGPHYESSEDADWFITTDDQHGGIRAARAGVVTRYEKSSMERTCAAGPLSFWYRVSSEEGYDWFEFYIDDVMQFRDSGEGTWQYYSTTLSSGEQVVKWRYRKDRSGDYGEDTVFIDDVELVGDVTAWHDIVALTDPGATSAEWTPTGTSTTCKVHVRSSYDGGTSFGLWDESDGTFTIESSGLVGDLDNDGDVDLGDLGILLAAYGSCTGDHNYSEVADIDNSGCVDLADLGFLLAHYGESLP